MAANGICSCREDLSQTRTQTYDDALFLSYPENQNGARTRNPRRRRGQNDGVDAQSESFPDLYQPDWTRTSDSLLPKQVRYQLHHRPISGGTIARKSPLVKTTQVM